MRKPDQALEPSIEEILASIRKIIADDGAQSRGVSARPVVPQTTPDFEPASYSGYPRQTESEPNNAFEPEEPRELGSDDEIIELTEDIMLDDRAAAESSDLTESAGAAARHMPQTQAADPTAGDPEPVTHQGLESVFSNVAAEVQRLSSGQQTIAENASASSSEGWDRSDDVRHAVETYTAALLSRERSSTSQDTVPETKAEPMIRQPAPAPFPSHLAPPSGAQRPGARPVWSARDLEGDSARTRIRKGRDEKPKDLAGPPPRQHAGAGRDSWAEGVQMPVPESGPTVPFASSLEEVSVPSRPPAAETSRTDIEKEKGYVGDMLTRVFGRAQKKEIEDEAPAAAADLKSKAEKLAKATVSDFASDKLRAPVVADVLHADKPFMETITDSLETALANIDAGKLEKAEAADQAEDRSMTEAQPAPYDELPDALLPLDSEPVSFGAPIKTHAPAQPAAAKTAAAPQPAADTPAPTSERNGLGRTSRSGLFADSSDTGPLLSRPSSLAPAAMHPSSSAQAVIPAGLEDSIKEMIKPLIIQWLNDNLPRIVEKAVREELAELGPLTGVRREGGVRR